MHATGAITSYIDVAQLALYAFWIFFAGLIIYLRREDKREGYPLENERSPHVTVQGWPKMPSPKTFLLRDGGIRVAPRAEAPEVQPNSVAGNWPGSPLDPTGDPLLAGIGPGAYANRPDVPDRTIDGDPRIVPLRVATTYAIERRDPDPRGMPVVAADGVVAGIVRDAWVDRSEALLRYFEVETTGGRSVMLPVNFSKVSARRREVQVRAITAAQFANVPALKVADQITLLEEEKVMAYYGGGILYATPGRMGPIL